MHTVQVIQNCAGLQYEILFINKHSRDRMRGREVVNSGAIVYKNVNGILSWASPCESMIRAYCNLDVFWYKRVRSGSTAHLDRKYWVTASSDGIAS